MTTTVREVAEAPDLVRLYGRAVLTSRGQRDRAVLWHVAGDVGRRYGAVSGDRNPIHLRPLTARLFGFPRAIAHGMWVKAAALAMVSDQLPPAFTVDARFKLPMLLPATAALSADVTAGGGLDVAVYDFDTAKPHLAATVRPTATVRPA